jgi:hypothetical protein
VGIEICNIHSLEAAGKPDILDTVIPYVYSDYVLYSSYESINVSPQQTANDIVFIRKKLAHFGKDSNNLIIGEMGFPATAYPYDTAAGKLAKIIDVVNKYNIPIAIVWTLIDSPTDFGAYDSNGIITPVGDTIKHTVCKSTAGINNETDNSLKLTVMPNPNNGDFQLNFTSATGDNYTIEIRNVLGQLFYAERLPNYNGEYSRKISLQGYPKGVYFVALKNNSLLSTQKIIVY